MYAQITSIDFYINTEMCQYAIQAFAYTPQLSYMKGINTQKMGTANNMFVSSGIVTIDEPFDFSSISQANNTAFLNANKLENVCFVKNSIYKSITFSSAVLSTNSIQSIIDGLATVETAQTLTLHADVKAKLTEEQLATITSKNWNVA